MVGPAEGIAAVNGRAVEYNGPPPVYGAPDVDYGPAPEPSRNKPAPCDGVLPENPSG